MLTALGQQWNTINKLDGDNFNYHFLYELHGPLFIKQEQLQTVPFVVALVISMVIIVLTVCLQIIKAVRFFPAVQLRV